MLSIFRSRFEGKYLNIYSIFLIIFLLHFLFIFQGLDVTDLGDHLTHQVYSYAKPVEIESTWPIVFLTDFVGGMWLSLKGEPSVLWARIGGVLVIAISGALIFSILSKYFNQRQAFLAVLSSALIITSKYSNHIIDYYSFPTLLLIIELWIFDQIIQSSTPRRRSFFSFMLGFMIIPIVLSRFTFILILILPVVMLLYFSLKKMSLSPYKQNVIFAIMGLACSAIIFSLFYGYLGIFRDYLSYIFTSMIKSANGDDKNYSIASLFLIYLKDYAKIGIYTAAFVSLVYSLSIVKERVGNRLTEVLILLIVVCTICFISISGISTQFFIITIHKAAVGIILLLSGLFLYIDRCKNSNLTLLIICGMIIMLITPIGSGLGLAPSNFGMWLILPLSILCVCKVEDQVKNDRLSVMLSLKNEIIIMVLILTLFFHATNTFRDDPNRLNLNTGFSHSSLDGIYSTHDRVEAVDELLEQIEKYTDGGDEVLMVNFIPLFHYLTKTKPSFHGHPCLDDNFPSFTIEKVKIAQKNLEDEGRYPKILVFAKVDTENDYWPKESDIHKNITLYNAISKYPETIICLKILENMLSNNLLNEKRTGDQGISNYLKDRYINHLHFKLLWENRAFEIYGS
jgi:hypothetical protein